jgi:arabinofuranosyltransferase
MFTPDSGSLSNRPKIIDSADSDNFMTWYLLNMAKVILVVIGLVLFVQRSWVGEDAFIFFKYVDNMVNGHGLVFNLGERVEGFTSALWVFVLAAIRAMTRLELRPTAIILGLILSTTAIVLLTYRKDQKYFMPLAAVLLITNSAFRDYATSGFETALTNLLLVVLLLAVIRGEQFKNPLAVAITASLLVLNRPEAFLLLAYIGFIILHRSWINKDLLLLIKFALPPAFLLGSYQIFRMGYFAALLPNTFYAKKGGTLYISQGLHYLGDFAKSYPFTVLLLLALLVVSLWHYKKLGNTKHLIVMFALLTSYVIYAGGDYMHGRSLLMAFITLCFAMENVVHLLLDTYKEKLKISPTNIMPISIMALVVIAIISLSQVSYTIRAKKPVHNIADERSRFGYGFRSQTFKQYLRLPITNELGWAARGLYYRELSEKLDENISVVNTNIGYFGYAVGDRVNVMGGVLIDPVLARQKLTTRGKIGHENDLPPEYILLRKPTFAYTPFKEWNDPAHFKWEQAPHAAAITDDSNDSFVPLLDISNQELIAKFSELTGRDIMAEIDTAQVNYLSTVTPSTVSDSTKDYLSFLQTFWVPYTTDGNRDLFYKTLDRINLSDLKGRFQDATKYEIWKYTTGDLNSSSFWSNITYAITH